MLPAIVLAAGASTRMGSPKALLEAPGGRAFVVQIVEAFIEAGVHDVVVVTGEEHERIAGALDQASLRHRVRVVRNPDPSRGQLSSLWAGMDASIVPATEGVLVTLVDVPGMTAAVVRQVVEAWRRTGAPIVRPAIGDRHGHPVLFDRAVFDDLRRAPLEGGAKTVVRAREAEIWNEPVDDDGCLVDVDTPDDYRALSRS